MVLYIQHLQNIKGEERDKSFRAHLGKFIYLNFSEAGYEILIWILYSKILLYVVLKCLRWQIKKFFYMFITNHIKAMYFTEMF